MKRIFAVICMTCVSLVAMAQTASPNAVFMGDSIFEHWGKKVPAFFTDNNIVNKGISGETTARMLKRLDRDVIALKPKALVILAGTNDIARNDGEYVSPEKIRDNIAAMAIKAEKQGIAVVICSVLPCRYYSWRQQLHPEETIIYLNTLLQQFAYESGYIYVDFHSALADEENGLPESFSKDGCHPNEAGYEAMEDVLLLAAGSVLGL